MPWMRSPRFALLLLLSIALLLARVGGVHLHLCFDGNEPPVTLHLQDGGVHHDEPGVTTPHHDIDVAAASDLLSKFSIEVLGLWFAFLLLGLAITAARRLLPHAYYPPIVQAPADFLPPLRGPPLPTSLQG